MAENRAYQRLKKLHPNAHWQRLETWASMGIADCNGCYNEVEVWVELKEGRVKKDGIIALNNPVRPAQIAWEHLRRAAGGHTYVALMLDRELFLLPGYTLALFRNGLSYDGIKLCCLDPVRLFYP